MKKLRFIGMLHTSEICHWQACQCWHTRHWRTYHEITQFFNITIKEYKNGNTNLKQGGNLKQ